jgi:hypothetical protein
MFIVGDGKVIDLKKPIERKSLGGKGVMLPAIYRKHSI